MHSLRHWWACDIALGVCLPDGGPSLLTFDALRVAFQYAGEASCRPPIHGRGRKHRLPPQAWKQLGGFDAQPIWPAVTMTCLFKTAVQSGLPGRLVYPSSID